MYLVLGADGKEYGPVDGEMLSQWITQGRANAQTSVKPEGSAGWQTLASVPEFQAAFDMMRSGQSGKVVLTWAEQ